MNYCSKCMEPIGEGELRCPCCGYAAGAEVPPHHLMPGTVLDRKFLVGTALGEGGFGITYIGRDLLLDMKVAIKEYYPSGYVNRSCTVSASVNCSSGEKGDFFETGKARFLREAQILARFSGSAGIVDVRDFFEENNTAYIVMEYLDGQTLKDYLRERGTLKPGETIGLLMPVMESLRRIHNEGLIHRDISPDNIMLSGGQVKLLDFGAARNVYALGNKSLSVMLKPGYAPEEQYRSKGNQGPWTDVYALCATMYKCITGITPDDAAQRVFKDELKAPSELGITIAPSVEAALMKGLRVLQKDRLQSIDELLDGLSGADPTQRIGAPASDDELKTVYGGIPNTDDARTVYGGVAEMNNASTVYVGSGRAGGGDMHFARASAQSESPAPMPNARRGGTASGRGRAGKPRGKSGAAAVPVPGAPSPAAPTGGKKKGKGRRIGMVLLSAVLVIVAIAAVSTIFSSLGSITIGGKKFDKNEDTVNLFGVTITEADMSAIASMGKLDRLFFSGCTFSDEVFGMLGNIQAPLKTLSFNDCIGIGSYSVISDIKYLQKLYIESCDLTDEQLAGIDFGAIEYLNVVYLDGNQQLTDISPLGAVKLLKELKLDKTAVHDFSSLADCNILYKVSAQECGITDISTLTNKTIQYLYLTDNDISDISAVSGYEALGDLYLGNNSVSDLSPLSGLRLLNDLDIRKNQVSDLSPLSSCQSLLSLWADDNMITTLAPLSGMQRLTYLHAERNRLIDLTGLEDSLLLEALYVSENQIENIDGITNCTVLERVDLSINNISDISLLKKSAATLERVYFNSNNVSDISCLAGTENLEYLSFDFNHVKDLDALSASTKLWLLSAESNEITSIDGIAGAKTLKYIFLPHNKIESMEAIADLTPREENDFALVDLSDNKITELRLSSEKSYSYLAVYNNPLTSVSAVGESHGGYFLFSYSDGMSFPDFRQAYNYYYIIDCPKDKQVAVNDEIRGTRTFSLNSGVIFGTAEEADAQIREKKSVVLGNSTAETDESGAGSSESAVPETVADN